MKKLPAAWRASASAGRTQQGSNCSVSSATGVWPSGMRATRKGTSKRLGRSRSVIQCAKREDLVGRQQQAARARTGRRRTVPWRCCGPWRRRPRRSTGRPSGMAGQQHAQFLEALADGGDGLRELHVGSACGRRVAMACAVRVAVVDAPAGEHVGAGREAGGGGAPRHQHFDAVRRVAQQQHGGGGAHGRRLALGMEELGGAYHGWRLSAPRCAARRVTASAAVPRIIGCGPPPPG